MKRRRVVDPRVPASEQMGEKFRERPVFYFGTSCLDSYDVWGRIIPDGGGGGNATAAGAAGSFAIHIWAPGYTAR